MASAHRRNKKALKRAKEAAKQAGATAGSVEEALAAQIAAPGGRVPLVISAGDDGNIVLSCVGAFNRGNVALPPLMAASQIAVASGMAGASGKKALPAPMGMAVVRQRNHLEVWGLGALADAPAAQSSVVTDLEAPSRAKHALRTRMLFAVASAGTSHVAAVSVSPCGVLLSYVADEDVHVLQVDVQGAGDTSEQVAVRRVRVAWSAPYGHGVAAVQCLPGGKSLAVATTDGCVTVLACQTSADKSSSSSSSDSDSASGTSESDSDSDAESSSSAGSAASGGSAAESDDDSDSSGHEGAQSDEEDTAGAEVFPLAPGVTVRKVKVFRVPCSAAAAAAVSLQAPDKGAAAGGDDADSESDDREIASASKGGGKRGTKRRAAGAAAAHSGSASKKPRAAAAVSGAALTAFALGGCVVACDVHGKWLAISDVSHVVHVLNLTADPASGASAYHKALPRLVAHPSAMAFAPPVTPKAATSELAIVGIGGALATVDASTGMLTAWARENMAALPAYYVNRFARGAEPVAVTWYGPTKLLISTRSFMVAVDTALPAGEKGGSAKAKGGLAQGEGAHSALAAAKLVGKTGGRGSNANFRINASYTSVMAVAALGGDTGAAPHLLVAQADIGRLVAALPAAIAQSKFGST